MVGVGAAQDVELLSIGRHRVGANKREGVRRPHQVGRHHLPLAQRVCHVGAGQQVISRPDIPAGPVNDNVVAH